MMNKLTQHLNKYVDCSVDESEHIIQYLAHLSPNDSEILEEKFTDTGLKIKYLHSITSCTYQKSVGYIKDSFEKGLSLLFQAYAPSLDIAKVRGADCLFRMGINEHLASYMVIFSYDSNSLIVKAFDKYFIKRSSCDNKLFEIGRKYPRVLTTKECIKYILDRNCSLSRFGDGEINLCHGESIGFQRISIELQKRLIEVLEYGCDENILVTIPEFCSKYNNCSHASTDISWWEYFWLQLFDKTSKHLKHEWYGNTDISRNTVFYENDIVEIKKLWEKRDIVFVLGNKGRFEIKPELFNNILSHEIVYVPPTNAFSEFTAILKSCQEYSKEKLFLLSAGPTATVLAFDLMRMGYQALDIGHLPNCYDQFLGRREPEQIPYVRRRSTPYTPYKPYEGI